MQSMATSDVGAVVLAAGLSSRMGEQKLLLSWQNRTVIETVVETLLSSNQLSISVVTGRDAEQIKKILSPYPVITSLNPDFANGNMVTSLLTGIRSFGTGIRAILMVLGDQPQMQVPTVQSMIEGFKHHPDSICIPSFNMRRGHPWIIPVKFWPDLFNLRPDQTMRDFIRMNEKAIHYVLVDTQTILADLDTPEDYHHQKPV